MIETERLILIPMTYSFISKIIKDDKSIYGDMGLVINKDWPHHDLKEILYLIKLKLVLTNDPDGFESWIFIDKKNKIIVGDGGYKGKPDKDGEIEIGYLITKQFRKKGYGYEAIRALIEWGLKQDNVNVIRAVCLNNNIPSMKLLKKVGLNKYHSDNKYFYYEILRSDNTFTSMT